MNLRGILAAPTRPGFDQPGAAGVCGSCEHTPTKHYRRSWIDKLMKTAKSSQHCTAQYDSQDGSGMPEVCMCSDSYHRRHFL
jgi:hypothetical protein